MSDPIGDPVKQVISRLQSPVPDISTLLPLLASPLDSLGLLPPKFRRYNLDSLPRNAVVSHRHVPLLQRVLLQHVAETWREDLTDEGAIVLLEQYFCPDSFLFASRAAGEVTLLAYSTILSLPLTAFSIHLLVRLTKEYPIDRLYAAVFPTDAPATPAKKCYSWEDCVRNVVAVPAKVANSLGGKGVEIPPLLEHATYFNNLSLRCESLVFSLSDRPSKGM
jgi:telomere length regulation protein